MRYKLLVILFIIIILLLASCGEKTNEEIFYEAQKVIVNLENYRCTAEITLYGNKDPETYIVRQWFMSPDKYKIESIKPQSLKGKTTIYNGNKAFICHPRIGQEWIMKDFENSLEEKMFIGHFINNFLNTESGIIRRENIDSKEYILLETEIPGNHPYFIKERLWFDVNRYYPYRLQILDKDDKLRIDVRYHDFKYNDELDENIFKINKSL